MHIVYKLLQENDAREVPISSHIWVAPTTFKQLENLKNKIGIRATYGAT